MAIPKFREVVHRGQVKNPGCLNAVRTQPADKRSKLSSLTSRFLRNSTLVLLLLLSFAAVVPFAAAAPAIDHEQCQPGPESGTNGILSDCITNSNPNGWKSGTNAGPFNQGESIPYRATMSNTVIDAIYTLAIQYDITKSGEHAQDYLTTFDRTMTNADACSDYGNTAICADVDTSAIPIDPQVTAGLDGIIGTADDIIQESGNFTLYGGTINSVTYTGGTVTGTGTAGDPFIYAGTDTREITVVYTIDLASGGSGSNVFGPVLTWGGHIARTFDWTNANPSGSPYHMAFNSWTCTAGDCGTGAQNLGLSSGAVRTADLTMTVTSDLTAVVTYDFGDAPATYGDPSHGLYPAAQGGTLTYTLEIINLGPDNAANLIVTNVLPAGVTYVSDTAGCTEGPTGTLVCALGDLAFGLSTSFDILATVDLTTVGDIINTASVVADTLESDTASNTGTLVITAIEPNLYLGSESPDTETGSQSNADATGDNISGVDDEDGVTFQLFAAESSAEIQASVTATNNTGNDSVVCGWLDRWADDDMGGATLDGIFDTVADGPDDQGLACQTVPDGGATLAFYWSGLPNVAGHTYARFKICVAQFDCDDPVGLSSLGEVEDYRIDFDFTPTLVTIGRTELSVVSVVEFLGEFGLESKTSAELLALLSVWDPDAAVALAGADAASIISALTAYLDPDGDGQVAMFFWETLMERGTIGFYVHRQLGNGSWELINKRMLLGLIVAPMGGEYMLVDPGAQPGNVYHYRLIEQEAKGSTRSYGPFTVEMP